MQLNKDVHETLRQFGDEKAINNSLFKELLDVSINSILSKDTNLSSNFQKINNLEYQEQKSIISSLIYLFYEAAKHNYKSLELGILLEEDISKSERIKVICDTFEASKDKIRNLLEENSFQFPSLIDVDWRLDYVIKTNTLQKTNEPLYTLNLKLSNGETKFFICSLSELQELSSKLSDATKQVIFKFSNLG